MCETQATIFRVGNRIHMMIVIDLCEYHQKDENTVVEMLAGLYKEIRSSESSDEISQEEIDFA